MSKRTHVSQTGAPFTLSPREQDKDGWSKPRGLWYEVDGDWRHFCRTSDWHPENLVYLHSVELGKENILVVDTLEKFDAFHRKYYFDNGWRSGVAWARVAKEYDGIEIAPYRWERRLDGVGGSFTNTLWYYTWDCGSGCIWRPKGAVVGKGRKLPVRTKTKEVSTLREAMRTAAYA